MRRYQKDKCHVIYRGGQHVVYCDGLFHYAQPTDGGRGWRQGKCVCYEGAVARAEERVHEAEIAQRRDEIS